MQVSSWPGLGIAGANARFEEHALVGLRFRCVDHSDERVGHRGYVQLAWCEVAVVATGEPWLEVSRRDVREKIFNHIEVIGDFSRRSVDIVAQDIEDDVISCRDNLAQ